MKIFVLKSKIHNLRVEDKRLHYEGSLGLPSKLMREANLYPFERVEVYNITNGKRFSTYVVESDRVILLGAAARMGEVGDLLIVASYTLIDESEAKTWKPKIVVL